MYWKKAVIGTVVAVAAWSVGSPAEARSQGPVNWSGLYFGGHAGYTWADADWKMVHPMVLNEVSESLDFDNASAGVHVGFQHQIRRWVFGGEVSLTSGPKSDIQDGVDLYYGTPVGTMKMDMDWVFTATAKVGYAWDRWLAYVKGGYAGAQIGLSASDNVPSPYYGILTRDYHSGWTIGAGGEYALFDGVSVGLEYNYINFSNSLSSQLYELTSPPVPLRAPDVKSKIDADVHSVMARISFKLSRPEAYADASFK
ncbi:MAG: outer membrane protein [Hyphomicrobiaceae bacterium]